MCVLRLCGSTGNCIQKNRTSKVQNQAMSGSEAPSENKTLRSPNRNKTVNPDTMSPVEPKNEARNGQKKEIRDLEVGLGVMSHGVVGIINTNNYGNKNVNNRNYDNDHSSGNSKNDHIDVISTNGISNAVYNTKNTNNNINNDNANDFNSESSNGDYGDHLKQGQVLSASSVHSNALSGSKKKGMINKGLRRSISNILPKNKQDNYFIVEVTDSSNMGANEVNICICMLTYINEYIYVFIYLRGI